MARLRYADISTPADAHLVQDIREQRDEVPHLYRQVPDAVHANVRRFFDDKGGRTHRLGRDLQHGLTVPGGSRDSLDRRDGVSGPSQRQSR